MNRTGTTIEHRAVRVLAAACLALALVGTALAVPAGAGELEGMTIDAREGATASKEYPVGSIPAQDPSGEFHTPADCVDLPSCAVVPLTVAYPEGFDRDMQEFFLDVVITWDQGKVEVDTGRRVGGQNVRESVQGNDLDIYFYTKKPDPKDPKKMKDTEIGRAATANMPEKARLFGGFDVYDIVITNYSGVNRGFTIDVTFVPAFITTPFFGEGNEPAFTRPVGAQDLAGSPDSGFLDLSTPGPAAFRAPEGAATPLLEPTGSDGLLSGAVGASSLGDGEFGDADPSFDAALAGTRKSASSLFEEARRPGPAGPVSTAVLLFWLALVPLLLAAAAAVVFIRRRPTALSFDVATA